MAITISEIEQISDTEIRLTVSGIQSGIGYVVSVSDELVSFTGKVLDPSADTGAFTGIGTAPKLISATLVDATHIDVVFDKVMSSDPILTYAANYAITGETTGNVASAVRSTDGLSVRLTLASPLLYGDYTLEAINCPDLSDNILDPENATADFSAVRDNHLSDVVPTKGDKTAGCVVEVRALGVEVDGEYPEIALKIDDEEVARWTNIRGNEPYRWAERLAYVHPGLVVPSQIKVEYLNDDLGGPEQECLNHWEVEGSSTMLATYEYERFDHFRPSAKLTLIAPSGGDVNVLNALYQDLDDIEVGQTVTVSGQFLAAEGVTARVRYTLGALTASLDLEGTGEWENFRLDELTATEGNVTGQIRLIAVSPDSGGTVVQWRDVRAGLEMLQNREFDGTLLPWYCHDASKCTATIMTDEEETYVHGQLDIIPSEPTRRVYHNLTFDVARGVTVLFAGFMIDGTVMGDTWEYNSTSHTWEEKHPEGDISPSARILHAACYDSLRERVVIFGGRDTGSVHLQDLWAWDGTSWEDITPEGTKPTARRASAMAYDALRDKIVLFGGIIGSAENAETWEYDCAAGTWALITPAGGVFPTARHYHSMDYDAVKHRVVLFGGRPGLTHSGETWEYNGGTQTWVLMVPLTNSPTARDEHKMCYNSDRGRMVIFSGNPGPFSTTTFPEDTWEYDSATVDWNLAQSGGDPGGSNPEGRVAAAMAYDSLNHVVVLFGGYIGTAFDNMTWEYSSNTGWALRYTGYDPLGYGPTHWNSVIQHPGMVPDGSQIIARGKYRAPVGTMVRIEMYAIPWTTGLQAAWSPWPGTGEWEDFDVGEIIVPADHRITELRLIIWSPDADGSWADWKGVSMTRNIAHNSKFSDRSAVIDGVLIDGQLYETEGAEISSTGSWLPGDGATPGTGKRQTEYLTNNGAFDFADVDDDELMDGADARIDTYRKGAGVVTVQTSLGAPVAGVTVEVAQLTSSFLFGCNAFMWWEGYTEPGSPPLPEQAQAWSDRWRTLFPQMFNFATLPFYWYGNFFENGNTYNYQRQDCVAWCLENGIMPKGHPLWWNYSEPTWLSSYSDLDAVKAKVWEYIETCLTDCPEIGFWDAVNETAVWDTIWLYVQSPASTRMWQRDGQVKFIQDVFAYARSVASPGTQFLINDYHVDDPYAAVLLDLAATEGGIPFDKIGIQCHMHEDVWSNQKIWQICQRFGAIHPHLHFTEASIMSGVPLTESGELVTDLSENNMHTWPTTEKGEIQQAAEVARFYKMLFSHPAVEAITWWDSSDYNAWLGAPRGLLRSDLSLKPSWTALHNLIKGTWWTNLSGITNVAGQYSFRGFSGTHRITVRRGNWSVYRDVPLTTDGAAWTIIFDE